MRERLIYQHSSYNVQAVLKVFTTASSTTAFAKDKVLSKDEQIANNIEFESELEESLDYFLESAIIRDYSCKRSPL